MQSVCQNKHVMKQEEAVREDLPLSLQMEYKKCMRRARNDRLSGTISGSLRNT